MQNIDTVLNANRFAVDGLFRQYKVRGTTDMEKIRDGYHNHGGGAFMIKLMQTITPKTTNGYDPTLMDYQTPDNFLAGTATDPVIPQEAATVKPTTTGWTWWDNFLGAIGKTAGTVGGAITAVKGPITATDPAVVQQQQQLAASETKTTNILYVGAALFVVVIIIILITKK